MLEPPSNQIKIASLYNRLLETLGERLTVTTCSKATLVHISHALEGTILNRRIPALLFTGFQLSSYWYQETERYLELAQVARQIGIFSGGALPLNHNTQLIQVDLDPDDPLRQEWFLVILSESFCVLLCGQDNLQPTTQEATRMFDTILSFEPETVNIAMDVVEAAVGNYRPEKLGSIQAARAEYKLGNPDISLINYLMNNILQFEERLREKVLQEQQRADRQTYGLALEQTRAKLLADFVRDASHDFRTPLSVINTSIHLLNRVTDPERRQHHMEVLEAQSNHLNKLVDALFLMVQLDSSDYLALQALDLNHFVQRLYNGVKHLVEAKMLAFSLELSAETATIQADESKLYQALYKIIENAVQYTPENGHIGLRVVLRDEQALIEISDDGVGINEADLVRVFDRFFKTDAARSANTGSLGLGLTIAQKIIEQHRGTIIVESTPGTGSTFRVMLPVTGVG